METALTLALDGSPLAGEQVVVFGQGIVGLLLAAILIRFPLLFGALSPSAKADSLPPDFLSLCFQR